MLATRLFGVAHDGREIQVHRIANEILEVQVLDYGVRLQSLNYVPLNRELVLGFDSADAYLADKSSMGAVCGRYAGRIRDGVFHLQGVRVELPCNLGRHHIHGGAGGFGQRLWSVAEIDHGYRFLLTSQHGDQGYPGTLVTEVDVTLLENRLTYHYRAQCSQDTVINLTNHAYFNLGGGDVIDDHWLQVRAAERLALDDDNVPTGELLPVEDTRFDLGSPHQLVDDFDDCYILSADEDYPVTVTAKGLRMRIGTTEPAVQVYTANSLPEPHTALCLETQHCPDSPNHPAFPSTFLAAGTVFESTTTYEFETAS